MAWADVPAKLALWSGKEYYMANGISRLIAGYNGKGADVSTVPERDRIEFEARLDYYIAAGDNLATSIAWTSEMLRKV